MAEKAVAGIPFNPASRQVKVHRAVVIGADKSQLYPFRALIAAEGTQHQRRRMSLNRFADLHRAGRNELADGIGTALSCAVGQINQPGCQFPVIRALVIPNNSISVFHKNPSLCLTSAACRRRYSRPAAPR